MYTEYKTFTRGKHEGVKWARATVTVQKVESSKEKIWKLWDFLSYR